MERSLSLIPRPEEVRDVRSIAPPVQFSLTEIKRHFDDSLDGIKGQYAVADLLLADGNEVGCKTIWRSQVVLAEGLLDFYIHEMSKFCLFRMFTGQWDKTEKYSAFQIPMCRVEEAISAVESRDWFFDYLNSRFSRDVFLSVESMRDQLNLIGIGFVPVLVRAFPKSKDEESKSYGTQVVKDLFQRRNNIAHQNDRSHASAEQTDITKEYVEDYIGKIEKLVGAMQAIAVEKG
jgi:hypothetical protein